MNVEARQRTLRRAWWYHALPLLALAAIDTAFFYMLDITFEQRKRELISTSKHFDELTDPYNQFASKIKPESVRFRETPQEYFKRDRELLESTANSILAEDNFFWKIVVEDQHGERLLEVANPEKMEQLNTWENCLFSYDFYGELVKLNTPRPDFWIRTRFSYTSPRGWPEIENLLLTFRTIAAAVIVISLLLYFWLYRALLRPLLRVANALEDMSRGKQVTPIAGAGSVFEHNFNELVESQRAIRLQSDIDRALYDIRLTQHPDDTFESLLDLIPSLVAKDYICPVVALYRAASNECFIINSQDGSADSPAIPRELSFPESKTDVEEWRTASIPAGFWIVPLVSRGKKVGLTLADLSDSLDPHQAALSIKRILESGLEAARTDADRLAEERNRFGMTLATSMGHDLTNIIATSKWDLQTLERAKELGIIQISANRDKTYSEAVEALRQNLFFLQDIVDIYRAVGYAKRPTYEEVDLGLLMKNVTELYSRSTSRRLHIECITSGKIRIVVEPRLLKMVVFNLLANSSQVIQRRQDGKFGGKIEVFVESNNEYALIRVQDDGPGIRNREGALLSEDELHKIFRAGYTTKPVEDSGGLGLSWVRHIVEEFHKGKVYAYNRKEGGAEFHIHLPYTTP